MDKPSFALALVTALLSTAQIIGTLTICVGVVVMLLA